MSKLSPLGSGVPGRTLSFLYGAAVALRNERYRRFPRLPHKIGRPVISVGGIHAGGTGKTPLVALIAEWCQAHGREIVFLSRGYKRRTSGIVIAEPGELKSWEEVGDEPSLLKKNFPSAWLGVGADRTAVARNIVPRLSQGAICILDDGFQHRKIFRDFNIACVPPDPFNDQLIPAGTLREPLSSLSRADMICPIGLAGDLPLLEQSRSLLQKDFPHAAVEILLQTDHVWIDAATGAPLTTCPFKKPLVLTGIARSDRFMRLLEELNITPLKTVCYEDHHPFSEREIAQLPFNDVDGVITTEKDFMRLSTINLVKQLNICYLKIKLYSLNGGFEKKLFYFFSGKSSSLS